MRVCVYEEDDLKYPKMLFFCCFQLILSHGSKCFSSFKFVQVQCTKKWSFVIFFCVSVYRSEPLNWFFPKKHSFLCLFFHQTIQLVMPFCCFIFTYNWFLKFFSIVLVFVFSAETWIGTALQSVHWIPTNWYLHQAKEKETANIKGPSNANVIR